MNPVTSAIALTGRLWWRHWPQLVLLVLVGFLANQLLLKVAIQIGIANHLIGAAFPIRAARSFASH